MIKISIVVPVYNLENYIEKCIKSILSQTYSDFELLLINDGSTDDSLSVMKKYDKDPRIKLLSKANGGLSDARNYGIKHSVGEYIMFIDGDDFLLNDRCLEKIVNELINTKGDILQYKTVRFFSKKEKYIYNAKETKKVLKSDVCSYIGEMNRAGNISVSACDKIIKRDLIVNNNLFFEKDLLSEDVMWSLQLYLQASSICYLDEDIYVYRQQREGSISTTKNSKLCEDLFYIIEYWSDYVYDDKRFKKVYLNIISYWYLILRVNFKSTQYTIEMKKFFKKKDKEMLSYHDNPKVLMAFKTSRIVGVSITLKAMRVYLYLKNKGLIAL